MGRKWSLDEAVRLTTPCVYALCDQDGVAFYVGKTKRPWRRFREHTWLGSHKNAALKEKIAAVGPRLKIEILAENPTDLNAEERRQITHRVGLLNLIGPHHWSWERQSGKTPWMAGSGIMFPTRLALGKMDRAKRAICQKYLRSLPTEDRCAVEIEMYRELPIYSQRRCDRWLSIVGNRMLGCMENAQRSNI